MEENRPARITLDLLTKQSEAITLSNLNFLVQLESEIGASSMDKKLHLDHVMKWWTSFCFHLELLKHI